jgi:hypothetical protein
MIASVPPAMANQVFHLHAFDDVAAANRFFQASWCRIFCPIVRFAVLFGHKGCALFICHCEERSDEAIQSFFFSRFWIASLRSQ